MASDLEELKATKAGRFGGFFSANPFETLAKIRQIGSVDEFADELLTFASHVEGLTEPHLLGYFLAGLKLHIRMELRASEESTLSSAIQAARQAEAKLASAKALETLELGEVEIEARLKSLERQSYRIGGIDGPMRLRGKLGNSEIVVLIGTGSSHNFISKKLVEAEKLKVEPTPEIEVEMFVGSQVTSGFCRGVKVDLEACQVSVDCIPFPLFGVDLLLGGAWLQSLGKAMLYVADNSMEIELNGVTVKLVCDETIGLSTTATGYQPDE